jgi:hypothetical protein
VEWSEICSRRLTRHGLVEPQPDATPADVVRAMCGAHAQVMSAAELSVGLRMANGTQTSVRSALWTDHTLVKTFGPRGTVHLLPAVDLPLWTRALAAAPRTAPVMLTSEQLDDVVAAIGAALNHADLTVEELGDVVTANTGSWAADEVMPAFGGMWPRWRSAVQVAAHRGVLCFGPNRGRKVTYTNPGRLLPHLGFDPSPGTPDFLVRQYLHSYGPATPAHFAQWLAVPQEWAANVFAAVAAQLRPVDINGVTHWLNADDTTPALPPPQGVRLLPYFDAYVVGCHPRGTLFPGLAAQRALSGGQAGNFPVLLVNGTVAGVWHHRRAGRKAHLTVEPFGPLSSEQHEELGAQVERVGEILEATPVLTIGPVTIGRHA